MSLFLAEKMDRPIPEETLVKAREVLKRAEAEDAAQKPIGNPA